MSFRIRPKQPVLPGTIIENIANIYFDFNEPVITEPSVLVAEFSTGMPATEPGGLVLSPVPTQSSLRLELQDPADQIAQWMILGIDGRVLERGRSSVGRLFIDVGRLFPGTYLLSIRTHAALTYQRRFVKE